MDKVRVRFAPSPTGFLHVGGARTALFNWLFARNMGGKFIVRIEDSDVERSTLESEQGLLRDMRWLGLDWDEGPGIEGPFGPYRQSERLAFYRQAAETLLAKNIAYRCFCSEESLESKRLEAEAKHLVHHYDGTCLKLSSSEISRRIDTGEPFALRLRAPSKDFSIEDLVRGHVEWKAETLGDFIILRSNGMPVYNFCVVVDDAAMKISHVIRAEEHLPNTHRQLILYEALGFPPPLFAHVSLIFGSDKTKLSKRHGATSVGQYEIDGYLPDAMNNFLALLGWNDGTNQELFSRTDLIQKFSLERVGKSPAVFGQTKLAWMNGQHIRLLPIETLLELLSQRFQKEFPADPRITDVQSLTKLISLIRNAPSTLNDFTKVAAPILQRGAPENDEARAVLETPNIAALFETLREKFSPIEWKPEPINQALKEAGKAVGAKGKALFMPVRVVLTGNSHGPDLIGIIEILGRDEVIKRLVCKAC